MCTVVDRTAISSGKYRYEVEEITFSGPEVFATADDGFESERVINIAESDNDTESHSGIDPEDLPGGFELRRTPIGAVVAVWVAANGDATNEVTAWFDRPGEFFGACDE